MNNQEKSDRIHHQIPHSVAALWSMMLPGLGQMMKGQILSGIVWGIFVAGGYYAYFWPGLILHSLCIVEAAFHSGKHSLLHRIGLFMTVLALIAYIYYRNI